MTETITPRRSTASSDPVKALSPDLPRRMDAIPTLAPLPNAHAPRTDSTAAAVRATTSGAIALARL